MTLSYYKKTAKENTEYFLAIQPLISINVSIVYDLPGRERLWDKPEIWSVRETASIQSPSVFTCCATSCLIKKIKLNFIVSKTGEYWSLRILLDAFVSA